MADTHLIRRLPAGAGWSWQLAGVDGPAQGGAGTLADAAAVIGTRPVTLLLAGTEALLTRVRLPVRSRSRARAAIPWALEDRLAEEVEDLHFALGRVDGEHWPVAVASRDRLTALLADCGEAGLDVRSLVPEPLALPRPEPGHWTVLEEPGRITVRTGSATGFACEPELLGAVASAEEVPAGLHVQRTVDATPAAWPPGWEDLEAESATSVHTPFAALAGARQSPIDLLQGSFSRNEKRLEALRQWRLPAGLAAGLLLVAGVQAVQTYAELGARQTALQQQIQTVFRDTFPEARATRDPRTQMETRLRALRGDGREDSRFAETVLRAGEVVSGHNGARLSGLTWREGLLELEVEAEQLAALDAIQRGLGERGLPAELRGVDRGEGDRVTGRLRVTGAGS